MLRYVLLFMQKYVSSPINSPRGFFPRSQNRPPSASPTRAQTPSSGRARAEPPKGANGTPSATPAPWWPSYDHDHGRDSNKYK